jgi:hypothetical protein
MMRPIAIAALLTLAACAGQSGQPQRAGAAPTPYDNAVADCLVLNNCAALPRPTPLSEAQVAEMELRCRAAATRPLPVRAQFCACLSQSLASTFTQEQLAAAVGAEQRDPEEPNVVKARIIARQCAEAAERQS